MYTSTPANVNMACMRETLLCQLSPSSTLRYTSLGTVREYRILNLLSRATPQGLFPARGLGATPAAHTVKTAGCGAVCTRSRRMAGFSEYGHENYGEFHKDLRAPLLRWLWWYILILFYSLPWGNWREILEQKLEHYLHIAEYLRRRQTLIYDQEFQRHLTLILLTWTI